MVAMVTMLGVAYLAAAVAFSPGEKPLDSFDLKAALESIAKAKSQQYNCSVAISYQVYCNRL